MRSSKGPLMRFLYRCRFPGGHVQIRSLPKNPHGHGCVAVLSLRLECLKPPLKHYPENPDTIGDHLLKRRLDSGLFQKDVAARIRVTSFTIRNWERNKAEPEVQHLPAIIRFLGYIPFNVGDSFGELMRTYRYVRGLSIDKLTSELGINPGTLSRIESGIPPMPCVKRRLAKHFHMIISEADMLQSGSVLKERITEAIENIK